MAKLFKTLTIGGIIGFVAGLLFAPKKGEETREELKKSIEKGKGKIDEIKEEFSRKEDE